MITHVRYIIYINGYSTNGCYKSKRHAIGLFKELKKLVEEGTHLVLYRGWEERSPDLGCFCEVIDEYRKPFRKRRPI